MDTQALSDQMSGSLGLSKMVYEHLKEQLK
jgi:hypothetical protein